MLRKRSLLATVLFALPGRGAGRAADMPGVTKTEIKIGNTMPYSGPASAYGAIGKWRAAFFKMVNDQGGINGRKINFISLDDGYSPPKTVEQMPAAWWSRTTSRSSSTRSARPPTPRSRNT